MSSLPPEPDPATALICPDCGEPISPEGLAFLLEVGLDGPVRPVAGFPVTDDDLITTEVAPEVVEASPLPTVRRIPMEHPKKKALAVPYPRPGSR